MEKNVAQIRIEAAGKSHSAVIARLIMQAMNEDCCLYFAGEHHTLADFERMMTGLVAAEDSQYSYRNALVAKNDAEDVVGVCVSYDGAELHRLRRAFINAAKQAFDRDFSGMDDETSAGELYLDSLAVDEKWRGKGIASALLRASIKKAKEMRLPAAGLLVDKGNPSAERLYLKSGFKFVNESSWGGHPMKHLQYADFGRAED